VNGKIVSATEIQGREKFLPLWMVRKRHRDGDGGEIEDPALEGMGEIPIARREN
jgi:hypothetical protein